MLSKTDLENLYHLTGEILDLEREIKKAEKKIQEISKNASVFVGDTYKDYSHNANGNIKIVQGYGLNDSDYKKQQSYYEYLRLKRNNLIDCKMELEKELEKIDDVIILRIIRLKFFDRFPWEMVAVAIDPTKSGEAMRKRFNRFFENTG